MIFYFFLFFSKNCPRVPPSLSSEFLLVLGNIIGCKIWLENRSVSGNIASCWYWVGQLSVSFWTHQIIKFSFDSSRIEISRKFTKTFIAICKVISATIQDWFVAFDAACVCSHLSQIKQEGEKFSKSLKNYSGTPWLFFSEKYFLSILSGKSILSCSTLTYKQNEVLFSSLSCLMHLWGNKMCQNSQFSTSSPGHSFATICISFVTSVF